jgi:hypothetical protein
MHSAAPRLARGSAIAPDDAAAEAAATGLAILWRPPPRPRPVANTAYPALSAGLCA